MKRIFAGGGIAFLTGVLAPAAQEPNVDLLIVGAHLVTMDEGHSVIDDGVLAVGKFDDVVLFRRETVETNLRVAAQSNAVHADQTDIPNGGERNLVGG